MEDLPNFQQTGFELFFRLVCESERPVEVISIGSCRLRGSRLQPQLELMPGRWAIHPSAGALVRHFSANGLPDTLAAYRLADERPAHQPLPARATADGPFDKGENNVLVASTSWISWWEMEPMLRNYIVFAFLHKNRTDYLSLHGKPARPKKAAFRNYRIDRWSGSGGCHYIWETSWQQADWSSTTSWRSTWCSFPGSRQPERIFDEGLHPVTVIALRSDCSASPRPTNLATSISTTSVPELHQQVPSRGVAHTLQKSYRIEPLNQKPELCKHCGQLF